MPRSAAATAALSGTGTTTTASEDCCDCRVRSAGLYVGPGTDLRPAGVVVRRNVGCVCNVRFVGIPFGVSLVLRRGAAGACSRRPCRRATKSCVHRRICSHTGVGDAASCRSRWHCITLVTAACSSSSSRLAPGAQTRSEVPLRCMSALASATCGAEAAVVAAAAAAGMAGLQTPR